MIIRPKGRRGSVGMFDAAELEKRRVAAKKLKAATTAKTKVNAKLVRSAAEKGQPGRAISDMTAQPSSG